jgi:predicted RNA-binding Zn ribbon-like protein
MELARIRAPRLGQFAFELTGGALCLDFANTLDNRRREHPRELLAGFPQFVAWSRQAGALTSDQAARLLRRAARRPAAARTILQRAIALREAIYRIFSACSKNSAAPPADLALLNAAAANAFRNLRIGRTRRGFVWEWEDDPAALDRMLWPVLRSAADLLISPELQRVRECAAGTCGWLFLDHSKNGSRRWCDMKICGNRAKVKRFYKRQRAS